MFISRFHRVSIYYKGDHINLDVKVAEYPDDFAILIIYYAGTKEILDIPIWKESFQEIKNIIQNKIENND